MLFLFSVVVLKQLIERLDNSVDKDTADQASKIRKLYEL